MPVREDISIQSIDTISSFPKPVLRNLLITQCYWELSAALARRSATGTNWCTFATWASKQAGQTIRKEDLRRTLEHLVKKEPAVQYAVSAVIKIAKKKEDHPALRQFREVAISRLVTTAVGAAADAVSRGNKKVFEEIAREFARFISNCLEDRIYDKTRIDDFCSELKPGPPPDGQDFLAKGFRCYYTAFFEEDKKERTQLQFLGNLTIGYHEQNRLQPEIEESLEVPIDDRIKDELLKRLFPDAGWWTRIRIFFKSLFGFSALDKAIAALIKLIQHQLRLALTDHLMKITLPPDDCLPLSRDLTMIYPGDLREITNAELAELLVLVDPTPNSLLESGATDWANLKERMHYITDMFRCYHQSSELFDAPFAAEQVTSIKDGKLPPGRL